jgi:excinuclease UvrABC ATPase subunit
VNNELLKIRGAREHNLKDVKLDLPRNKMIVMTGISGSGKSSLAFDTIYAEGQRRYVESLSSYARQFLGQLDKPDVDLIEGLSPAISIDQKAGTSNPRSTVGTVTEIYDYLRVLYARIGEPHCYECGRPVSRQSPEQITDRIMEMEEGSKIMVLAPLVRGRKGEHSAVFENLRHRGYVRVLVDGEVFDLSEDISLDKNRKHEIMAVVDRLVLKEGARSRVAESVEAALHLGEGMVAVQDETDRRDIFSEEFSCVHCAISFPELSPRMFSFNNPYGACTTCGGLGYRPEIDAELVVPDQERTLIDGAVAPWEAATQTHFYSMLEALGEMYGFKLTVPFADLDERAKRIVLFGTGEDEILVRHRDSRNRERTYYTTWEGVIPILERRYRETESEYARWRIGMFMSVKPCPACGGARLRPESLAVTVGGLNIAQLSDLTVEHAIVFIKDLKLDSRQKTIAGRLLKEVRSRLQFLMDVGLDYLTVSRQANTLAGGESQRIRLATQIGSGRPLHPGRAERRPPHARQQPAHRDPQEAPRPRQHSDSRRARRGHHPRRRPHSGHWARGGDPRRPRGRHGQRRGPYREQEVDHREVPFRRARDTCPFEPPQAHRQGSGCQRSHRAQPQGHRRVLPARRLHLRHRGQRLGQEHPGERRAVPGAQAEAFVVEDAPRAPQGDRGRGADRQGRQHRPVTDRPHPEVEPGDLHEGLRRGQDPVREHAAGEGEGL